MTDEERKDTKTILLELINVQKLNITSEYMRGLYNGFVTVYNSIYDDKLALIDSINVNDHE